MTLSLDIFADVELAKIGAPNTTKLGKMGKCECNGCCLLIELAQRDWEESIA